MEIYFLVFLMLLSDLVYFLAFMSFLKKFCPSGFELVLLLEWKSLDLTLSQLLHKLFSTGT